MKSWGMFRGFVREDIGKPVVLGEVVGRLCFFEGTEIDGGRFPVAHMLTPHGSRMFCGSRHYKIPDDEWLDKLDEFEKISASEGKLYSGFGAHVRENHEAWAKEDPSITDPLRYVGVRFDDDGDSGFDSVFGTGKTSGHAGATEGGRRDGEQG